MDYEKQLATLRNDLDKAKTAKLKAEATLEQLELQKKQIEDELSEMNIKPEDLEDYIGDLKKEIEKLLNEADELMPKDF